MLADSIEATVKSLQKPTPKGIEATVAGPIIKKVEGGQFNECELKMREIHLVGDAIRDAVIGFFGPRIQYPS
jgi:membrane-associated HD superfamily phosphohydrolase